MLMVLDHPWDGQISVICFLPIENATGLREPTFG